MSTDFLSAARMAYDNLKFFFGSSNNYWQLGNAFDTATDYLRMVWNEHPDPDMVKNAYDAYTNLDTQQTACWYDDYGWWGIASSKAFDMSYAPIFNGDDPAKDYIGFFRRVALNCWETMNNGKNDGVHLGAPKVWENKDNISRFSTPPPPAPQDYWNPLAPLFDNGIGSGLHGTWQYDIFYNKREEPAWGGPPECNSGTNPSDPHLSDVRLGPYQLTVMNGLFLVLGLRLTRYGVSQAWGPANDEYGFLMAWFAMDPNHTIDADHSLLYWCSDTEALIRERVGLYAPYNGTQQEVEHWDDQTCWGGDAGLILGGMTDYLALYPGSIPAEAVARMVTAGVARFMSDADGLHPWYPITNNKLESWDAGDYKCGSGVFMRYLLHAYQSPDSAIKYVVESDSFQQFLCNAALKACDAPQNDLFDSLNVLATLTTALQLLKNPAQCQE